jgi:hypothetical protein
MPFLFEEQVHSRLPSAIYLKTIPDGSFFYSVHQLQIHLEMIKFQNGANIESWSDLGCSSYYAIGGNRRFPV